MASGNRPLRQETDHCLGECWSSYMSPCGITRPQLVNPVLPICDKLPVQQVTKISSEWWHFCFSLWLIPYLKHSVAAMLHNLWLWGAGCRDPVQRLIRWCDGTIEVLEYQYLNILWLIQLDKKMLLHLNNHEVKFVLQFIENCSYRLKTVSSMLWKILILQY